MRLALIISLVVNVFLAFAFASGAVFDAVTGPGHEGRRDGPPPERRQHDGPGPETILSPHSFRFLPEESREAARAQLRTRMPEARDIFREMMGARDEAIALLAADDFDADAYRAASREVDALRDQAHRLMTDTMIDIVAALPTEERQALARDIIERRERARERYRDFQQRRGERESDRPDRPATGDGD